MAVNEWSESIRSNSATARAKHALPEFDILKERKNGKRVNEIRCNKEIYIVVWINQTDRVQSNEPYEICVNAIVFMRIEEIDLWSIAR